MSNLLLKRSMFQPACYWSFLGINQTEINKIHKFWLLCNLETFILLTIHIILAFFIRFIRPYKWIFIFLNYLYVFSQLVCLIQWCAVIGIFKCQISLIYTNHMCNLTRNLVCVWNFLCLSSLLWKCLHFLANLSIYLCFPVLSWGYWNKPWS